MSSAEESPRASAGAALPSRGGASSSADAWSGREWIALAALIGVLLVSLVWFVHPWYDATNDGSMYIACARSILSGEGYAFLGEPFRIRPPGLSYLIAPVIAVVGTDFQALNLTISLFGVLGVVLLFVFQRERLGWPLALCVALLVWLNPGYQRSCNQVMSEMPGVALLLAALCIERWAVRAPGLKSRLLRELLLGIAIAAAAYVRTVNVLLAPAIVAARVLRRPSADEAGAGAARLGLRLVPAAAVAVLLMLPWSLRNAAAEPPPPADQTYLYSYSTGMWHADAGDPRSPRLSFQDVLERVPTQSLKTVEVLGSRMKAVLPLRNGQLAYGSEWTIERDSGPLVWIVAIVLLAGALISLVKHRAPSDVFTWFALGVIAIYFGFDDRLLMPIFVLVLPATVGLVRDLVRTVAGERLSTTIVGVGVLLLAVIDIDPRGDWDRIRRQHEGFVAIADTARNALPSGARLAAPVGWHYGVYLERDVYSLQWNVIRAAREGASGPQAMEATIDARDIDAVLVSPRVPTDGTYLPYFKQRGYEGLVEAADVSLFRVR